MRRFAIDLLITSMSVVSACAIGTKVQAPFDSFVCYDSSFARCAEAVQATQLNAFHRAAYPKFASTHFRFKDDQSGLQHKTSDGQYSCQYGAVPYKQKLNPSDAAAVVFISPVLMSQIGEQDLRLKRVRDACDRVIDAYEYQLQILGLQDQLSVNQDGVNYFSSKIEGDRNVKQQFGLDALTDQEADQYGATHGLKFYEALTNARRDAASKSDSIRALYKKQTLQVEYKKLFDNANLAIDLQLRELGRELFVLDRAIVKADRTYPPIDGYETGSWVQKGTVVLRTWE
jgi:hypothetical protein